MLDTLNLRGGSTSQSVHVNAVTGAILKNHPKSWFTRFNLTSEYAKTLFAEGGHKAMKKVSIRSDPTDWRGYTRNERDPDKDITILQMVMRSSRSSSTPRTMRAERGQGRADGWCGYFVIGAGGSSRG